MYQKTWIKKAIQATEKNTDSWSPSEKLGDYKKIKNELLIKKR